MTAIAFLENAFFFQAKENPVYFVSVIATVVVSVVLHELGHGVAAIWQGDDTPRSSGHMTLDPLVHMGGLSLVLLFLAGIAWGMMPVDPSRFRSRYGDAIVSFAGPAVNLVLALVGLTALGLWLRLDPPSSTGAAGNFVTFLWVFGTVNIVLFLLNLVPLPPFDGSRVLASFSPPYARAIHNPDNQGMFMLVFVGIFLGASKLFEAAGWLAGEWLGILVA